MVLSQLKAEVVERNNCPGTWGVEAIDYENEGAIYLAVFSGPSAKERAMEYAHTKYNWAAVEH